MSDRLARQVLMDAIIRASRRSGISVRVDMINGTLPDWKQIGDLLSHPAIREDLDVQFRIDLLRGKGALPIDIDILDF